MGLNLVVKNADFSNIGMGKLNKLTSVTDGLQALYDMRNSAEYASSNLADSVYEGTVFGSPTVSSKSTDQDGDDYIDTGVTVKDGDHTVIFIFRHDQVYANGSLIAQAFSTSPFRGEYASMENEGTAMAFESLGAVTPYPIVTIPEPASDRYVMIACTLEQGVKATISHPATSDSDSTLNTTHSIDRSLSYRFADGNSPTVVGGVMLAYWNRALSPDEISKVYSEMKVYYISKGITI